MAAISQQLADITVLSIVVRILLSTFCAGTLGFERERHNQAAGFRTYIIVSDASALVMMTNIFVAGIGETDLVRMSASVITGLGFLGAGTILVTRNQEVRGLTTAAGLWAVAIIGTAFGAGFYAGGIICYAFIFLAMQVLRRVDLRIRKTQRVSTVYFEMEKKSTVGQIIRQVKGHGHYIWDLNLFSETQEKSGGPVASPEGVVPAEYRLWARELLKLSVDMRRQRPAPEISQGMRGMPMVMRVLLDADGPLSPGQIARAAGVTDARIANTLRALEQRGYIRREPSEHDRRRVEVIVTEEGRRRASEHFDELLDLVGGFLEELGERDTRDLIRILGHIGQVMEARRREGRQVCPPGAGDAGR